MATPLGRPIDLLIVLAPGVPSDADIRPLERALAALERPFTVRRAGSPDADAIVLLAPAGEAARLGEMRGAPVVVVCGRVGEDRVLELVRRGAADVVLDDDLDRLAPAIERALRMAGERRDLERADVARVDAERANRSKDDFLAVLSHELRTPLNSILGWARLLRTGRSTDGPHGLEVIERNARSLAQMVDDLLDVSRIIAAKLGIEPHEIDLARVVAAAVDSMRATAEEKRLDLGLEIAAGTLTLLGDGGRLQQVVGNLLSNAVKFTPRGGRVQVTVRPRGHLVDVVVSDTGDGIEPDFLPHVFERFRQADTSMTRRHSGLGLGLAIVRRIVELHGGSVRALSPGVGQGATFTVTLPLSADAVAGRSGPIPLPGAELGGVSVLVVDDEADARELLARLLQAHGADTVTAGTADEALGILGQRSVTVVVSDIGMPRVDGYELMRLLRARGDQTPAIALSAYAGDDARARSWEAGFQLHLPKPFDAAALTGAVARLAGRG